MRSSISVPTAKSWWANIFPVQTEQTRDIYYMADTFQNNIKQAPSKLY